ncbi:MAG TPA: hypothetical protein VGB43_03885 [Flavobacterium sp.]
MKKITLLFSMVIITLFSGCNKDDDSPELPAAPNINGEWNLVNVSNSTTLNDNFAPGLITWTFSSNSNTIEVVNNNTDDTMESILLTGSYSYSVEENTGTAECSKNIFIDTIDFGCFTLTNDEMTIGHADGVVIKLVR